MNIETKNLAELESALASAEREYQLAVEFGADEDTLDDLETEMCDAHDAWKAAYLATKQSENKP